jgi:uncharacterized protein YyaL (SSP411 family)
MPTPSASRRLANETSPYLLQHRDNPVDWYPWGEEALARARAEDRPILLSIGYSSCHWCHVMARESFEDEATARRMNEHFVNIKVDREERPDIDSIYMTAVQQMTGQGGWPLTVFLTPGGVPFFGGTYFPPEPRHGMPSFRQLLSAIAEAYRTRRSEIDRSAAELHALLEQSAALRAPATEALGPEVLDAAYRAIAANFDAVHGGFGRTPKFPQPMALDFLLRTWKRTGDAEALAMVDLTLRQMAAGGIYDHLGGGFHRYSVDARWLVPHFEKMLYDNALLARVYLHAYQATGESEHLRIAEETIDYVLREMRSPEGGFYSAQDADSEGEEGRFYVWTPNEVDRRLGPEEGPLFRAYYDITPAGNWSGDPHRPRPEPTSILHVERPLDEVAAGAGVTPERLEGALQRGRAVLYGARAERVHPHLDDKVLTSWNAMMLHTLAEAARITGRDDYRDAAIANADFLLRELRQAGELLRSWKDGTARVPAFLEDYALLVDALLALYPVTFDARWVAEAIALADALIERFWADAEGVFYDTAAGGEALLVRPRDFYDNPTPSGNSAAVLALLHLTALTGERRYEEVALRALDGMGRLLVELPAGFAHLLAALDFHLAVPQEVAIVGRVGAADTRALTRALARCYLPNTVLASAEPDGVAAAAERVPLLAGREAADGRATAYVCERYACRLPVTDAEALAAELAR